jgi:hypothetical protein
VSDRAGAVELELRTEVVELVDLTRGELGYAVRVDYRPAGSRRWSHFNLIPKPGQTLEALVKHAQLAAQLVHAGAAVDVDAATGAIAAAELDDGGAAA